MPEPKQLFEEYYGDLMRSAHSDKMALGLSRSVSAFRAGRAKALERFPHTVKLAEEVKRLKEDCVGRLDELVQKATEILEENGAQVHYAETADDALKTIGEIVGSGKVLVSGKTLTGEEIGLREHLESLGNEYWETDCAQFIQQLRKEKPMHYVYPSLHITREEVAEILNKLLGREVPTDITTEIRTIREFVRAKYFKADIGISGANVMGADTGTIFLLESEGNIRMSTTVPPVHIALVGIEKIVPTLHDAFKVAEVTWRYAGFTIPLYVSMISGPSGTADIECTLVHGSSGPLELHVIFLDNGRTTLAKDPLLKEALRCMKCGACLFECPVFELAAGYYGGHGYFGGLGAILTAYMSGGLDQATPIAYTCLRCGRCTEVCPQKINLANLILELRHRIASMAKR